MTDVIRGVIPVVPTIFREDEDLDLTGQRRVVDYVVDSGSSALCILANYSEQFSLTDEEREHVVRTTLEQANGRIPVVVTTSHYSARVAAERSQQAQEMGAEMVMLMPPFFGTNLRVDTPAVIDFFKRVADRVDIPIMLQDAPMSGTTLSAEDIAQLSHEVPLIQYVKIEMPGTADKLRSIKALAGSTLPGLYDGEEAITLIPDLDAGAQGTMSSCMVPDVLADIVQAYLAGDRGGAIKVWEDLLPLIHFENRQCGLRAAKVLLKEGGIISSSRTRSPFGEMNTHTRQGLLELARRKDTLILNWAS
jgi:4-hydroxy-tetrahydrodipicolinate synthase